MLENIINHQGSIMNSLQHLEDGNPIVLVPQEGSAPPKSRTNLACYACRSHHLKCDGRQPVCSRCQSDAKQCVYMKSRRGGFDKATLTKKRAEKAQLQMQALSIPIVSETFSTQLEMPTLLSSSGSTGILTQGTIAANFTTQVPIHISHRPMIHGERDLVPQISASLNTSVQLPVPDQNFAQRTAVTGHSECPCISSVQNWDHSLLSEKQLDLYYVFLYESHPFVLPKLDLQHYWNTRVDGMQHLMNVIQCWGSFYADDIDSTPLAELVKEESKQISLPANGFTVQAHILQSIALHCWDELEAARATLDKAVTLALSIEMNLKHFASDNGNSSPLLEESWRRTWWSLFITDLLFTGVRGLNTFSLRTIPTTVDLPCAEELYHSGEFLTPLSLAEYDSRHFANEAMEFSSFAYLIDAARLLAHVFYIAQEKGESFDRIVSSIDTKLVSWTLNLPKEKKHLVNRDGKVDELLFQAHILINTATVHLHRPRSKLAVNLQEASSRCAPIPGCGLSSGSLSNAHGLHTAKTLIAAKAVITMFTLPTSLIRHSPLMLCQLGFSSFAYLSACTFVLKGSFWQDAKDLVQVSIGAFNVYAELWPLSARTLRQLKSAGREVFPLENNNFAVDVSDPLGSSVVFDPIAWEYAENSNLGNGHNSHSDNIDQDLQVEIPDNWLDISLDTAMYDEIFQLSQTSNRSWMWNGP